MKNQKIKSWPHGRHSYQSHPKEIDKMSIKKGVSLKRRTILKSIPALSAVSAAGQFFTGTAQAQEGLEYGYTICDNCNQMPMCGIRSKNKATPLFLSAIGKNTTETAVQ